MKLNITICDDENVEVEYLTKLVQDWADIRKVDITIKAFSSAEAFLFSYETDKSVDILLLDIQMKQLDGVGLAKQLRASGEQMQIIFITGFPEFIAEGYDVSALHYLMKPVSEDKLYEVLDKAVELLSKQENIIITETADRQTKLNFKDIMYAEAFAHKTTIYTTTGDADAKLYISDLEDMLDDTFCRIHRSYIVNIQYINQITKTEVVLDNGTKIPLSRRRYNDVNKMFIYFHKK